MALANFSGLVSPLPSSVTELVASLVPSLCISFSLGLIAFAILEHCFVFSRSLSPQESAVSCCGLLKYLCLPSSRYLPHSCCHLLSFLLLETEAALLPLAALQFKSGLVNVS